MTILTLLCLLFTISGLHAASPPGDVVGQITVGYQGWFTAQGDGSPRGTWYHWSSNVVPSPGHQTFNNWPEVSEYENLYQTGYANLGNGQPARLFSSWDAQSVQTHFRWMSENGIHTAGIQRFGGAVGGSEGDFINGVAENAVRSAEQYGVKVYAMYDVSGWTSFQQDIKTDFNNHVQSWINSPAYARQNDKPVVCIWGLGFKDRPGNPDSARDIINFLKSNGAYVIGGVPRGWRTLDGDSCENYADVYTSFDMISPWTVGGFNGVNGALNYKNVEQADLDYCNQHNIDYQPVVFPGFAWSNWNGGTPNQIPRLGGDFMWRQFLNLRDLGISSAYVAMFDEYDEGTAIAKTAPTKNDAPPDQYFYTLDEDGIQMSSDFYLRLVNDGGRLIRGEIGPSDQKPTPYF